MSKSFLCQLFFSCLFVHYKGPCYSSLRHVSCSKLSSRKLYMCITLLRYFCSFTYGGFLVKGFYLLLCSISNTRLVCIFSVPRTSEQLQERDRYIEGCKWKTSQQVCGYKILWLCLVISLLLKTLYLSFINKYFSLNSVQWHLRKRDILNILIDFKWCSNIVTHLRNL